MSAHSQYQLYRESSLGKALTDTLDELIQDSLLDPQTAMKVLSQFDVSISEALQTKVKARANLKVLKNNVGAFTSISFL